MNSGLKTPTVYTVIIAVTMCVIISLCTAFICFTIAPPDEVAIGAYQRVIVIDAGHGGIDRGTIGVVTGNYESDLNLWTARLLYQKLEAVGLRSIMTRQDENGLYGDLSPGFKRRDMQRRAEIIKQSSPIITISIHMNKYTAPTRRGAQVYYQKGDSSAQSLANAIQSTLNAEINLTEGGRSFSSLAGDYYVCRVSPCPAVIVECGFLSNPEDDRLLDTEEYRQKIANAIKNGICEYLALMTIAP